MFKEIRSDVFTNNVVSAALVNNEPLRAYILLLEVHILKFHSPYRPIALD